MDERAADILEATVREFIRLGEPVSSGWLYERYDFGVKPAMIRAELNDLTDRGYFVQPHHSAGRVPTNRGYEFFAKRALEDEDADTFDRGLRELFERMAWPKFVAQLSEDLGLLGVAADPKEGQVYKDGLQGLIDHLAWGSRQELRSVIRDFEEIDARVRSAEELMDEEDFLKVFIGRKSPVTRSQCLSVIAADYGVDGDRVVLLAIGPKRMDYQKTATVFRGLKKVDKHGGK